jgi:phosphotriesterase-related protein
MDTIPPASHRSPAHIGSGQVMTVLGPIDARTLGITLMHEHILNDCRCWWHKPPEPERQHLAEGPVRLEILGELRMDPFVNLANCALDDEPLAISELGMFAGLGGRSIVDPTCRGIGRNPEALARISTATGLNIVMGAGYYLESSPQRPPSPPERSLRRSPGRSCARRRALRGAVYASG